MPLIFRSMLPDGDLPQVGPAANALGARLGPLAEGNDTPVAEDGTVQPGTGGMSVAPSVAALPDHRIPKTLALRFPRARGNKNLVVWKMGTGPFEAGEVAEGVALRLDPDAPQRHGFVEPERTMTADEYQQALAATQKEWVPAGGDD
jgi:hypothetical protein